MTAERLDEDRGTAEWTVVSTEADGGRLPVRSCDCFECEDGLIRTKNGFRKQPAG